MSDDFQDNMSSDDQISEDDWAAAMAEQVPPSAPNVQPATGLFPSFDTPNTANGVMNELDMILDIPVQITVELGRTKITIKNLKG